DEALEASLLLHVVDAADPDFEHQLEVTATVLADIGAGASARLLVLNKIDRLGEAEAETRARLLARWPDAVVMSARRPEDVARLRQQIVDFFARQLVEEELRVPYDRQNLRGEIFAACQVIEERYEEDA